MKEISTTTNFAEWRSATVDEIKTFCGLRNVFVVNNKKCLNWPYDFFVAQIFQQGVSWR